MSSGTQNVRHMVAEHRSDSPTLGFWGSGRVQSNEGVTVPERDDLDAHPLPSPYTTSRKPRMADKPRVLTASHSLPTPHDDWSSDHGHHSPGVSPSSACLVDSPSSISHSSPAIPPNMQNYLERSASEDDSILSDSGYAHSPARSPLVTSGLPDPSIYPDPYPNRPPRWQHGSTTPALSSGDSSTASTRSSAYTNSARSGEYGHVHVVSGEGDLGVSTGINTDDVAQRLARGAGSSSSLQGRTPFDQSRWSDPYTNSVRSRSSSVGNRNDSIHEGAFRVLRATPSFDMSWQASVDERDEAGLGSEDDMTDEDGCLDDDDQEDEVDQPTSAALIAEEGRGIIVRGDDVPIVRLQAKPGTTHLLIGSSRTANAIPSFLSSTLPIISNTLLALDISANFLEAIPPALAGCVNLEELNIASNPLRALPEFLSRLTSLRLLIVDSTGIGTLPESLCTLDKLHTLSMRRNKLNFLPSWLCLLPSLETLLIDGNPFQGPWRALMEPLLATVPMTPLYPPSTPMLPLPSASAGSTNTEPDGDDLCGNAWPDGDGQLPPGAEEEDTVTTACAPQLARSVTAPIPVPPGDGASHRLSRTRTTPNKAHFEKHRGTSRSVTASDGPPLPTTSKVTQDSTSSGDKEVRKMKSAGELRRKHANTVQGSSVSATPSPLRAAMSEYVTSASSSDLLNAASPRGSQVLPKRFASLGVASASSSSHPNRSPLSPDGSFWDSTPIDEDDILGEEQGNTMSRRSALPRDHTHAPQTEPNSPALSQLPSLPPKEEREKTRRWGFLKKMSMGKMRSDSTARLPAQGRPHASSFARPPLSRSASVTPGVPQIDVRISTTGALLNPPQSLTTTPPDGSAPTVFRQPSMDFHPPRLPQKPSMDALKVQISSSSSNLLAPSPTPRSNKRRSFLPVDMSPIPIPAASTFVTGVTASNGPDDELEEPRHYPPSPIPKDTTEELHRREMERAGEARIRALRSVMAYLRDMHDLSLSHTAAAGLEPPSAPRSRRPTMVDGGRLPSDSSLSSVSSIPPVPSRPESTAQLRSPESRIGSRSGSTTQTNSVATTDSSGSGSGEERKYKNDRAKRARIIREIVETERTYVKGLQELVDIYITPAAVPVNVLSGVGQKQETLVPAAERKIVFGGLESLFSFHKESFLPALERATAPVLVPSEDLFLTDADGYLSLDVAMKVAQTFVSHAAFMKMYSTYINNFDNSVQRIRAWTSDNKQGTAAGQTLSPSSSSAQLSVAGISVGAAGASADSASTLAISTLTSGQRKRIKAYLKRCRINPRHSQLNLEGYLLLPVQRIPRYRLLLEELVRSSPPMYDYVDDPLERALAEISSLANSMNEGKRESESRRRLVQWQSRIRGKFPSPLVQPHRRLIMDGPLQLKRVVRKATVSFPVINAQGDSSEVQIECLSPELTPRSLIGILCNDLLVLCRDSSDGQGPSSHVDLWAVLRMQTLPQPASIVHGNALRLVDNKAILYFEAPSTSDALTWFRAINQHIPASKA